LDDLKLKFAEGKSQPFKKWKVRLSKSLLARQYIWQFVCGKI